MARVLLGTAPQIAPQAPLEPSAARAWIEAHYETFRGQWVAVRLDEPALVASAPTLSQLLEGGDPAELKTCLVQYVYTVEQEHQPIGPWWQR